MSPEASQPSPFVAAFVTATVVPVIQLFIANSILSEQLITKSSTGHSSIITSSSIMIMFAVHCAVLPHSSVAVKITVTPPSAKLQTAVGALPL